jgi:hypothetical protein
MSKSSVKALGDELGRLMAEHIESMKNRTYLGSTEEEFRIAEKRLKRIRKLSDDYLLTFKTAPTSIGPSSDEKES